MAAAFIAGRQFFSAFLHFFAVAIAGAENSAEIRGFQHSPLGQFLPLFCRSGGKSGPLTT
ncbi:hypothetical protein OOT33_03850 [Sphingobium sp. DEHP117]|uniref:hypothetical protein n=1 Tax=Sphingobium sp. DEHP117 TaxID=2993436 RepID=UPI0027D57D25|nr:hypothetical protein [Sphingobium sp. DEHP117]MDQ4419573.1 hypothetical protein [Sphingobium sp. DEHP117]